MEIENLKLRKFSLSDLDQITEIEKVSFPPGTVYSKSYFEKLYHSYPQGFLIAEILGKIIGYAIGQIKGNSAQIISIAVLPDWRKKGIGTKLFNSLLDFFKKEGAKEIFLHVRTKNQEAISFYQNLGFEILEEIKNYYPDGNAYLMKGVGSSPSPYSPT